MNTSDNCSVLKDVIAYVDVWSSDKTANYSKPFIQQLNEMGAQVSKTFNKQVTHVIFNNGHPATWAKAKKSQVKLVSVLWVDKCYDDGIRVDEELFPALNDESNPILKNKKHRCMQPKDSPERTPENDRRMRKKLDKMMKDLAPKQPLVTDVSPIIIDEENGIIYSPSMKRSDYMARRLKDMKEKRENLSLTASQMFESSSPPGLKPSLGSSPTVLKYIQSEDDCSASADEPGYSPDKEEGRAQLDFEDHDLPKEPARRVMEKTWRSHCPDVFKRRTVSPLKCPSFEDTEEKEGGEMRKSVTKTQLEKPKSAGVLESPGQEMENSKKPLNEKTRSQIIVSNPAVKKNEHSPNKCERIKRNDKSAAKSSTETKICTLNSSPARSNDAACGEASPLPRKELRLPKRARASISALVRSFSELQTFASGSADGDDDVFEDIFSQANHHKKTQRSLLPVDRDIQIPFELEPVPKKRKQRRSESAASESSSIKKRKLEKGLTRRTRQSDANTEPEIHPQQDLKESPPALNSRKANTTLTAHRQSKLPFTKAITSHQKTHKTASTCVRPETSAGPDPQKHSDELYHKSESRGNERTAAAGLTEVSEDEDNQKQSLALQKISKTKAMRTLVMTSMPTEKQHMVVQVVKALGGFCLADQVCESTTHVVSGGHKRTLNVLLGIARGCWILSFEWILWCLEQRQWIPEEPYELSEQFPAAQICRLQRHLSAGEHQQDLFQDQPSMFVSQHSQPPAQSLMELIRLFGGTVCKSVRQAGICFGNHSGRRPEGSRILSEQWVLDSITHLRLLPYDDYDLE